MKRLLLAAASAVALSGCMGNHPSPFVSFEVSTEADQFRVLRRIDHINVATGEVLFTVTGYCSVFHRPQFVAIICRVGPSLYDQHTFDEAEGTTWVVEQLQPTFLPDRP